MIGNCPYSLVEWFEDLLVLHLECVEFDEVLDFLFDRLVLELLQS